MKRNFAEQTKIEKQQIVYKWRSLRLIYTDTMFFKTE